jgi:hypothetical protein
MDQGKENGLGCVFLALIVPLLLVIGVVALNNVIRAYMDSAWRVHDIWFLCPSGDVVFCAATAARNCAIASDSAD